MIRVFSFLFFTIWAFGAYAQFDIDYTQQERFQIGGIRVQGANNFSADAIQVISGLRPGATIVVPGDDISRAIKNLWDEGLFSDVQIKIEQMSEGVIYLIIQLTPRPKLTRFQFEGAKRKEVEKIRERIKLFAGKTITESLVEDTRLRVINFFKEEGYHDVRVYIDRKTDDLLDNSEMFVIRIEKGYKMKIAELEIFGLENTDFTPRQIRRAMRDTKRRSFFRFWKRSKFTDVAFKRDKEAVIEKFQGAGKRDAEIVRDSVFIIDAKNLGVHIFVDPGETYYFGDIEWIGNSKYTSGFLDTVLGIKRGDVFNKALLETRLFQSMDGRDISALYMDRGYLFFQVNPVEKSIVDNHINYEMRIMEGQEARIKNVIIKGNHKTNEHVIRREIRTRPGDLFNRNDIIRSQRELAQLGYFDEQNFDIIPIPNPQDGTVDIEYHLTERSSDQIELSGGYGAGIIIGTLGLSFNNFSIQNFFNKESWQPLPTGDGQRLALRAQTNGRFFQSYNLSFTEPWLGGRKPNALTYWANHTQLGNNFRKSDPGYQGVSITGTGIGIQRRKRIPDDFFRAYYEIGYQYFDVRNYGQFFEFDNGYSNDIAFKYVLSRNSIDAPIYPTSGSSLNFTAKATLPYSMFDGIEDYSLVSEQDRLRFNEYYKLKFTGEWFMPLSPDKKLVLHPKVGFGFMGAYSQAKGLTPFQRFYLGGNALQGVAMLDGRELISLRGYDEQVVSSQLGDPLIARYSMELRYPISLNPSATFFVLGFVEAGNTYRNFDSFNPFNVKRSFGGGVRIFLPMFGLLGFDYGWGIDGLDPHSAGFGNANDAMRRSGRPVGNFQFIIGGNLGDL
ncbi:MAG: outer membrane protein assembly factor BamA [Crocinitomicaceae bacterium]|nr:outer membrane protein assembly factor BamA [Crocinitomicaceae bacterium]